MKFSDVKKQLKLKQSKWLITGVAGFIGSNLLEFLLKHNQLVIGIDNFSTGFKHNLEKVKNEVGVENWSNFDFREGDIRDLNFVQDNLISGSYVLHQAALGSVPRSINDPLTTNSVNVSGFLNVLRVCCEIKVKSFVYAASSSSYGDHPALPKKENIIGNPLSPYAVSKLINELYADVFSRCYRFSSVGLRYFNVFGKRQNPKGAYAAVIPLWINNAIHGKDIFINGDGTTSRDFCFIENVIQANILAAIQPKEGHSIYNVSFGEATSLLNLAKTICESVNNPKVQIKFRDFRAGDVKHSLADISKIQKDLSYNPEYSLITGLASAIEWFDNEV